MFYKVLENNTILKSDNKESLTKLYSNVLELTNVNLSEFLKNQDKYELQDGVLVDISDTQEYKDKKALERKKAFKAQFFEIAEIPNSVEGEPALFVGGWYRKVPKGYNSAVESLNTAFNMVTVLGNLPANILTFYKAPDFYDETQTTEEWLIANSFKNEAMTTEVFGQFYAAFMTAWNMQEHE